MNSECDAVMLSLAYACGLRVSELCGLRWKDLQPRNQGGQALIYGKGSQSRIALIPHDLWLKLMALPRSSKTDALFYSYRHKPLERTTTQRYLAARPNQHSSQFLDSPLW